MVFSGAAFLFYFLPVTLGMYFITPKKLKNALLFIVSLVFYAWGEPVYVTIMLFSTMLDYCCGLGANHFRGRAAAKVFLLASVVINLAMLGYFKYYGSLVADIKLPVGISFYTFQTMSYTIDVYRGRTPVQRNIISLGAYVALFPQLIAGPIVRYKSIAEQLDKRMVTLEGFGSGARRFIMGLAKKILLANSIGLLWEEIRLMPSPSAALAWLGITAFAFQIYYDFSGYSDMAIGMGRMLGFHFPENFNYPYISRSVSEFWRRWHMTLGEWFRDYVYFPLGGSRKGALRTVRNLALVWLLTGVWHGAGINFMLWGLYFGFFVVIEKLFLIRVMEKLPRALGFIRNIYLLLIVLLGWTLFVFEDWSAGTRYLSAMLGAAAGDSGLLLYYLSEYGVLLLICASAATPLYRNLLTNRRIESIDRKPITRGLAVAAQTALLLLSVAYLISQSFNPFLYFRF